MTCIVGVEFNGKVYIGGDSAGIEDDGLEICGRADEKVFVVEDFVFGFSGSFRVGQLIRYAFIPPEHSQKKPDMAYMVTDFVDALKNMQREKGTLVKENDEETSTCPFLVGYRGKLYCVEADFNVGVTYDGYAAVGCGSQVALGALHALKHSKSTDPQKKIKSALEAAAEYNAGVRPPFKMVFK